ncbi:MAG: hypothetical protein RI947_845 [Candidatus Parcubacteria bacterium]|jgi:glycosyltransferase involved in cell wall biosynthesis
MSKHIYTVTIGIPAYNEAANIGYLLHEILGQTQEGFKIDKIVISSDNSTDSTKQIVEGFNTDLIEFIDNQNRKGQAFRQNQIIQQCKSDILILLNADISIKGPLFIKDLIDPIIHDGADLTSSNMLCIQPSSFFERVLYSGFITRNDMFEAYHEGNNLYTCHGAARAFSKRMYSSFTFKNSVGEDGYSYLYCMFNKLSYKYARHATALVKLPDTIKDHEKQSIRFLISKNEWAKEFGEAFVDIHRKLPLNLVLIKSLVAITRYPLFALCYMFVLLYMVLKSKFTSPMSQTWESSASSKRLHSQTQS